jgi:hypothetical protein
MGFISQKTAFFIVTAVKTSNLTQFHLLLGSAVGVTVTLRADREKPLLLSLSSGGLAPPTGSRY